MRLVTAALFVALGVAGTLVISRDFWSGKNNLRERQAHWEGLLMKTLPPGSTVDQLEAFATAQGQKLHCYQNHSKEALCDFVDKQSVGGTLKMPVKLLVVFKIDGTRMASYRFTTAGPQASEP